MIEGLLIGSDGFVQVIGQPRTYRPYIEYIRQLLVELESRVADELRDEVSQLSDEQLRDELTRRINSNKASDT